MLGKSNEIIYSKEDEITDFLVKEIKNEIKRRKIVFSSGTFIPSRLTECDRRILYRANGEQVSDDRYIEEVLLNQNEKYVKNKWIDFFANSIKIKMIEKSFVVADCNYNLTGIIDCIIKKGDVEFVILIKNRDGSPKRKDVIELMSYLWMVEKPHGILIYDSNNSTKLPTLYHIKMFSPIIVAISNKCRMIMDIQMKGKLPNRSYKNDKSPECLECEFKVKCWDIESGEKL